METGLELNDDPSVEIRLDINIVFCRRDLFMQIDDFA